MEAPHPYIWRKPPAPVRGSGSVLRLSGGMLYGRRWLSRKFCPGDYPAISPNSWEKWKKKKRFKNTKNPVYSSKEELIKLWSYQNTIVSYAYTFSRVLTSIHMFERYVTWRNKMCWAGCSSAGPDVGVKCSQTPTRSVSRVSMIPRTHAVYISILEAISIEPWFAFYIPQFR